MNYVNLVLNDELLLFANAYKCPLEARKDDCALTEISDSVEKVNEIYNEVKELDNLEKSDLARACKSCQTKCTAKQLVY